MTWQDALNGIFEIGIFIFIFFNICRILRDKDVKGFSVITVIFFHIWSVWNLFYYKNLDQNVSVLGVFIRECFGLVYLFLIFYYLHINKFHKKENNKHILIGSVITFFMYLPFSYLLVFWVGVSRISHVWPDVVNASFEFCAGFFCLIHCFRIVVDKKLRGLNPWGLVFTILWGVWNLYYYHHLGQNWSWWGGLSILVINCLYVCLIFKFVRKEEVVSEDI